MGKIKWYAKPLYVVMALALVVGFSLVPAMPVSAATIADVTPTDIPVGPAYTELTGPAITEDSAAEIGTGTIILTAPSGFEFDTTSDVTATVTGDVTQLKLGPDPGSDTQTVTPTETTITIDVYSVSATNPSTITYSGIKIRDVDNESGTTGDLTFSGTAGVSGSAGTLTSVPGPHAAYTVVPAATTQTAGTAFDVTITAVDDFGNTVTGIDDTLDGYTFTFSGPSDAPDGNTPTYGTMATFSGGVSSLSVTLVNAETVALTVEDDQMTPMTGTSDPITVNSAPIDHFAVTPDPPNPEAGQATSVTITAQDQYDNVIPGHAENLALSQSGADEPGHIAWTGDSVIDWGNGTGRFIGSWTDGSCVVNVSYTKAGDAVTLAVHGESSGRDGLSAPVTWGGATAVGFTVVTENSNVETAGTPFNVTVTAIDEYGNTVTGYTDEHDITFTSTATASPDGTEPTIPASETITFSSGVGESAGGGFTLTNAGETPTITATDGTLTGESDLITVNVGALASFTISGTPATVVAGAAFASPDNDITVRAYDASGNLKTDYTGTVTWSSSDEYPSVELPAGYTFTESDAGIHTFLGSSFRLFTAGDQTITVTDGGVSEESSAITVTPAEPAALSVAAEPGEVVANDISTSALTASILDDYGNPNPTASANITFTTDLGTFENDDVSITVATTDGEAIAHLKSPSAGTATIDVASVPEYTADSTTVTFTEWTINAIELTTDPGKIRNNGGKDPADVSTITARYVDASGETVTTATGVDYAVTFSITSGDGELSTTEPVNPVDGVATVTLTATTAVTPATITVQASGYSQTDTVDVTVIWGAIEVDLYEGWNLISLPLIPDNPAITEVISNSTLASGNVSSVGIVRGYDPATGGFPHYTPGDGGPLTEMHDGHGYWVFMNAADTLTAYGRVMPLPTEIPPTYPVVQGWNLIGFKSVADMTDWNGSTGYLASLHFYAEYDPYPVLWSYNAQTATYSNVKGDTMAVGHGFWLWMTEAMAIVPPE